MRMKKGAPKCGEVLVSFGIVDDDYAWKTPFKYVNLTKEVNFEEFFVEINVLGLRGL